MTAAPPLPLSPKQIAAIVGGKRHRLTLHEGAVRSGKSLAAALDFLTALPDAPRGLALIVGQSLSTIERNVIEMLCDPELFGDLAAEVHHTRGSTVATILGRTVHLIGASDERAEHRLRGMTASLVLCDEATLVPESFFTQLLARLSAPGARLIATTNPDAPRHWLKRKYLDRAAELDLGTWHFRLDDNPSLDPAYVAALEREFTGLWRRRMIEGAWVAAEGSIFDMWDEDRHVVDELPAMDRYWVGVDYGTVNPFAAVLLGLGVDRRLYAVAEWWHDSRAAHRQMTDAQYSAALREWLAGLGVEPEWVFVDPSAASFIAQLDEDGVLQVRRADNEVLDGIRTVSSVLAAGRLLVHASCENLRREMSSYVWDEKAAEQGEDKPLKVDDHAADSIRYACLTSAFDWWDTVMGGPHT